MDEFKKIVEKISISNTVKVLTLVGVFGGAIACFIGVGELLDNAINNTGKHSQYVAWLVLAGAVGSLLFGVIRMLIKRGQMRKLQEAINDVSTVAGESRERIARIEESIQSISDRMERLACIPSRNQEDRCHQIIINKLDEQSHFKYDTDDVTEELKTRLSKNTKIDHLKIICYGRSGYQDVIRLIARLNRDIRVELIMFNTENDRFISREKDREYIDRHIKDLKSRKKDVDVYVSTDPPMLRASALYEGDTPVWTAVQSYQLRYREDCIVEGNRRISVRRLDLHRPDDDSLIIICDKKSSKTDFDGVIHYFNSEFNRLMSNSKEAIITSDGRVEYRERADLTPKGNDNRTRCN